MTIRDDRNAQEKFTHHIIIMGRDSFLSGWGKAAGGSSYAGWACTEHDAESVYKWVLRRGDIKHVKRVDAGYSPSGKGHYHIYAVHAGHPALS